MYIYIYTIYILIFLSYMYIYRNIYVYIYIYRNECIYMEMVDFSRLSRLFLIEFTIFVASFYYVFYSLLQRFACMEILGIV